MSTNEMLEALLKIDRRPKLILEVEQQYNGCIFSDICKLIQAFCDETVCAKDPITIQCVTYALKALSLFSKYEESDISNILLAILKITKSPLNTAELALVAATSWAKVICNLYKHDVLARNKLLEEVESPTNDDFNKITLIGGILNCGCNNVIVNDHFFHDIFGSRIV